MQTLTPTAVRLNNLSGSAADLDDSPDAPDSSWCTRLGFTAWSASPSAGTLVFSGRTPSVNSGATGDTLFAWNCDSDATQVPSYSSAIVTFGGTTLGVSDNGRTCMRIDVTGVDGGNGGNRGIEPFGMPISFGSAYNFKVYMRWWMRFDSAFTWGSGNTAAPKCKAFRLGDTSDIGTIYFAKSDFFLEQVVSSRNIGVGYAFDPVADTSLRSWNEFILEFKMQTSSGSGDAYLRLYRNGTEVADVTGENFDSRGNTMYALWGSFGTRIYPQLYSTSGGGGYIYFDDITMTDYFYTTA